ncbi:MAG TPA: HPr(Ser) kinase/phosphatase [Candidatus Borkfalkia faecavium]|uniref:HPr kinase/phosphorylase n=1 Tax=Candidatus Borkfalkia faecavium TaxID=2838508 RepID=A0A9D1W1I1_9FIRM|nr:HPr(Ser) kinase/phosphatase [Candidatus Borkfalkia faecavium]
MNEQETILLESFCASLGLEVVFAGRGRMTLSSYSVVRPGLQLAGYFKYFDSSRIIVIGNSEYEYLRDLPLELRHERVQALMSYHDIPCIILTRDLPVPQEVIEQARLTGCPILRTDRVTTVLMNDLFYYLNKKLAPSITMHGVLMDVSGVGILITGHSGVGKSETAMELIKRGHRLVADDSVIIRREGDTLVGTSPELIRYFMELRGIGILNIKNMYGSGSILNEKSIELVMELEDWVEGKEYDRLGVGTQYETILNQKVMKHTIPVKPGRNLSIIIEVAARNFRLKSMGYDAAQELISRTIGR